LIVGIYIARRDLLYQWKEYPRGCLAEFQSVPHHEAFLLLCVVGVPDTRTAWVDGSIVVEPEDLRSLLLHDLPDGVHEAIRQRLRMAILKKLTELEKPDLWDLAEQVNILSSRVELVEDLGEQLEFEILTVKDNIHANVVRGILQRRRSAGGENDGKVNKEAVESDERDSRHAG
jgi:hypothetical protein